MGEENPKMREFFLLLGAVSAGQTPFQDLYGATCPPLHQCPQICKGPGSVSRQESNSQIPECPPGVGMIWDECKCCRKCASQKGQICDIMNPCDYTKGLSCQEINKKGEGICLPKPGGKTCFVNGHEYGNGEEFQPSHNSCTYTGICVNGDIGVFPTCARKPPSNCEKPKLCKAQKGKCCGEWACDGKGCKNGYQDNLPFLPAHRPTEIQTIRRDDNCYVRRRRGPHARGIVDGASGREYQTTILNAKCTRKLNYAKFDHVTTTTNSTAS